MYAVEVSDEPPVGSFRDRALFLNCLRLTALNAATDGKRPGRLIRRWTRQTRRAAVAVVAPDAQPPGPRFTRLPYVEPKPAPLNEEAIRNSAAAIAEQEVRDTARRREHGEWLTLWSSGLSKQEDWSMGNPPFLARLSGVRCPQCSGADVQVVDEPIYDDGDRYRAYCPSCLVRLRVRASIHVTFSDPQVDPEGEADRAYEAELAEMHLEDDGEG